MVLRKYNTQRVIKRCNNRCVYCESSDKELTTDHVVPISRTREYGLRRREAHTEGNLVAACRSCNESKGNDIDSFFDSNPEFMKNFLRNSNYVSDRVKEVLKRKGVFRKRR